MNTSNLIGVVMAAFIVGAFYNPRSTREKEIRHARPNSVAVSCSSSNKSGEGSGEGSSDKRFGIRALTRRRQPAGCRARPLPEGPEGEGFIAGT